MYPCKECLLKTICSESCDKFTDIPEIEISNEVIHKNICPFCETKIHICTDEFEDNDVIGEINYKRYECNTCRLKFTSYYDTINFRRRIVIGVGNDI